MDFGAKGDEPDF